ncbi:MAG TPA: heavy metal-binding domain-containing protein [Pirellulales bacterium]|jgi:DNA-directed RNA polymerase subunit RPC12/RpoP|nr:heavy metal-binding domain-containing protein [Pirellulales bacterium]
MWKALSMLFVAGAASALIVDAAHACGGCGSMGGGGGYRGRAVASRKASGGGPNLAQAGPASIRRSFHAAKDIAVKPESATFTVAAKTKATAKAAAKAPIYTCPMHPQVQWTTPTDCPLCGMKLKLKQRKSDAVKRGSPASGDHAAMNRDETTAEAEAMSDMPGTDDQMDGMDDTMMCPGCMMNMGGSKQAPAASQKASGGAMRGIPGMGCGC